MVHAVLSTIADIFSHTIKYYDIHSSSNTFTERLKGFVTLPILRNITKVITVETKPQFGESYPVLGVKPKRGWYAFWLFFKIGLCSAISFERSRRELSIDGAE